MSAIETRHPGVYVTEEAGMPAITGVGVNTAGFVGVAEKGPIDEALLITYPEQFNTYYGNFFRGSYLEEDVKYFFKQGGTRCYISRVVGSGAAQSWVNAKNSADSGGSASVIAGTAGPYNLDVGEHLDILIGGYASQVFTFTGTQAKVAGNGFTGAALNTLTLEIQFAGWDKTVITFSGLSPVATPTEVVNFLNPLLQGGSAIVNGVEIDFQADQVGSGSYVDITGGTALAALGHTVFKTYGTGNVPNIDAVTADDAAVALSGLVGAYAISYGGKLQLVTQEKGSTRTIQVEATTTATAFGFDTIVHYGWGSAGSPAAVVSTLVEPFNLEAGETLAVDVVGHITQTVTITGTQALLAGTAYTPVDVNTKTFQVKFSGYDAVTILFTGLPNPATPNDILTYVNEYLRGGSMYYDTDHFVLKADQYGSGSQVQTLGGTALGDLGYAVSGSLGSGNVANVNAVTADEMVSIITAGIVDVVASKTTTNGLMMQTVATGDSATIQVNVATTATNLGFDTIEHSGSDADFMDAILFRADNPGAWGNNLGIRTVAWSHTTRADVANLDTEISVSSVRGMSVGDLIYTYDPTFESKRYVGLIWAIDVAQKIISVIPMVSDMVGIIPPGSPIMSASQHRLVTRSMEILEDGADSLLVATVGALPVGARVTITDGTTLTSVEITSIDGNVIKFAPVSLTSPINSGAIVASQEWKLEVLEKGIVQETIEFLSMEENSQDYFGTRLAGDSNESIRIEAIDLYAAPTDDWRKIPLSVLSLSLAYGLDGATPTDDDFIGSDVNPKSGMYLLDEVAELNFFTISGITTVNVQLAMSQYTKARKTVMAIICPPRTDDQPMEAYNYRMFDLNVDNSQVALYYPWVQVRDPYGGNGTIFIPPTGYVMGQFVDTAANRGVHVPPANVSLQEVSGLTYYVSDGEQDILNPVGVNCIRFYPGEGIRIWGCRTLASVQDGRHYVNIRRELNFIMESVKRGNRWAVMQLNDPILWGMIEDSNKEFLHSLWLRGMLFPSNNESQAYFVKCDETTNPISEIKAGRLTCEIGVNCPYPAEFVIFRIGLFDGNISIEEAIARRG